MDYVLITIVAFAGGLIVGWNFIEQPKRVKEWIDRRRG